MYRPLFHFSPPSGWMNDPNGLVCANGLWHLLYQHQPTQLQHGPMHWGHAVSDDLARWQHRPIALFPDELGTIWSGSAAIRGSNEEELVAVYTQGDTPRGQLQSLAFSHDGGKTWKPYDHNPVLESDRPDFRDPKVFRFNDSWIMAVSGGHEAHFYSSPDLFTWTLLSTFPAPQGDWIWECPDLLEVDGQWILIVSFIVPGGKVAQGSCTRYWIGDFDGTHFVPHTEPLKLSFGPDDYAAVSWSNAPKGRKILIGWMSHWAYAGAIPTESENWRGAMTLPRELSIRNGALCQLPPRELNTLRGKALPLTENEIAFAGETFEIEAEIDLSDLQEDEVGFHLRVGEGEVTKILYRRATGELCLDRTQSGQTEFHPEFAGAFRAPLHLEDGVLKLRVFVDRCSVEVFAGDGALYGAALIFPASDSQGIEFVGKGARITRSAIYPITCS